jgi:hypothetical protein
MGWVQKLTGLVRSDRRMRDRGEDDAPTDPAHGTRETGGGKDTWVGRGGADETAGPGLTGGEARAGGEVPPDQGAGRDA